MAVGVDFPATGVSVPGDGSFFTWGTRQAGDLVAGAKVVWPVGTETNRRNGVMGTPPFGCQWTFTFEGVIADGTTVQLILFRLDATGGGPPTEVALVERTFKCTGHG